MFKYIIKRLLLLPFTLLAILSITFLLIQLLPGGPAEQLIAQSKTVHEAGGTAMHTVQQTHNIQAEQLAALKKYYGFDQPWWQRYLSMLKNYAQFNLGESYFQQRPVLELILSKLPVSISLGLGSLFITYLICIPLGVIKAIHQDKMWERASTIILLVLNAIPSFVLGILLLILLAGGNFWQIFPLRGLTSYNWAELGWVDKILDYLWHICLPLVAMVSSELAQLTLFTKNNLIEELSKHYVLILRAQNLSSLKFYRHILKNAILPIVANLPAGLVAALFSSTLLIENLFSLDGLGLLTFQAMSQRDYPVVLGSLYLFTLIGLLMKILTDLFYAYLDPRVRLDQGLKKN
jgi:microcin C transport system permease protein